MSYLENEESNLSMENTNITYKEAVNGDEKEKWKEAMGIEFKALHVNGVIELVKITNKNVI